MKITRRSFIGSGFAAAGIAGAPAILRGATPKRNFLFIHSDDLCNRLNCFGYPAVKSPNIDRLARSGVRFDRSYCQYSLCSPSRSSVMTGLAPDTVKVWDLQTHFRKNIPDVVTMPQAFRANGYFSGRAGKIYHYNVPSEIGTPGFDDPPSWDETANPAGADRTHDEEYVTYIVEPRARSGGSGPGVPGGRQEQGGGTGQGQRQGSPPPRGAGRRTPSVRISQDGKTPILPLSKNGDLGVAMAYCRSEFPDQQMTDYLVADAVINMMEKHRNEPWFIGAGFFRPHVAWIVPSKYFDMYRLEDMDVPPYDPNEKTGSPKRPRRPPLALTDQQHREAMRAYYASTTFMDAQVGRLLDALERLGLTKNTTIVFWGDNGFQLGEHGLWQKGSLFEMSAKVPMIIAGAGVKAMGKGCPRTVESLDMYPTALDLCGLQGAPGNLQGRSLAPLLANPDAPWDHPAITQTSHGNAGGYSMRTERYRYTLWMDRTGGEELYDYETDPREENNLADDSSVADLKAKLRVTLERIIRSRGFSGGA
jgi:iduronate 2-sulfatase